MGRGGQVTVLTLPAAEPTPGSAAGDAAARATPARRRSAAAVLAWLGLAPFAAYIALFLLLPTVLALGSGLFDSEGAFTWDNLSALVDPVILAGFWSTIWVSALTAVVGAVIGALVCYALLGLSEHSPVRRAVDAAAGVLAQFGGVMLAFVFIAAFGAQGVVTLLIQSVLGVDIYEGGMWLYDLPGLIGPYLYFQVPLMVITFMPALSALKPQWAEANLTLGGTRASFWTQIGIPVLAPAFLASLLLLFANAFSSYATAAALVSQGAPIIPLQIRAALTSETVLGRENLAGALALGMIAVVALVMWGYSVIQKRAARWQR
ncbi:ABC transporter permease [Microbacterium paludicola]|uniref:ABC transporter permease n=1 Tax=Microbacterium paludicola TaxID=300019 RepID=A0A4Y9FUT0_9MICO|nr:ABC transporter permease [Microbacterium paludicola]MBF0816343.1 ABC transporter permease [Microbacterium paludicola]TFU33006.1 ABC transporter permease [Microbacterium paludicola]